MKERKHIDRLFQEGFKDFEATPKDAIWQNIEAKLHHNKKKRRALPIWWRYAGIAALFLLLLTVGRIYFINDTSLPANQVVDTDGTFPEKSSITNNTIISSNNIVLDSIAKEENVEKMINLGRNVLNGYYPTKYFNLDLGKIINLNNYEGLRVGFGGITNSNFSHLSLKETFCDL